MRDIITFIESGKLKTPITPFSHAAIAHAHQTEIPWATHVHRWARLGTYKMRLDFVYAVQPIAIS